jgi:hypothetical protein
MTIASLHEIVPVPILPHLYDYYLSVFFLSIMVIFGQLCTCTRHFDTRR